jgi:hypothetical protein
MTTEPSSSELLTFPPAHNCTKPKFDIRCEHYSENNRDLLFQLLDDSYDVDYFEDADQQDIAEGKALEMGVGPLVGCKTVMNASSQKTYCRKTIYCYSFMISSNLSSL